MAPLPRSFPRDSGLGSGPRSPTRDVVLGALALSLLATLLTRSGVWPIAAHWSPVVLLVGAATVLLLRRPAEEPTARATLWAARSALVIAALAALLAVPLALGPAAVVGMWGVVVGLGGETVAVKDHRVPLGAVGALVVLVGLALRFHIV